VLEEGTPTSSADEIRDVRETTNIHEKAFENVAPTGTENVTAVPASSTSISSSLRNGLRPAVRSNHSRRSSQVSFSDTVDVISHPEASAPACAVRTVPEEEACIGSEPVPVSEETMEEAGLEGEFE
jgi:hypothetical protein